jgi:hypothetical protein
VVELVPGIEKPTVAKRSGVRAASAEYSFYSDIRVSRVYVILTRAMNEGTGNYQELVCVWTVHVTEATK